MDQLALGVAQLTQRCFEVGISGVSILGVCARLLGLDTESFDQTEPALVAATIIAQHSPGYAVAPRKACPIGDVVETAPNHAQGLSQDVVNRIGGHPSMQISLQRVEDFGDDVLESLGARASCLHQWCMSRRPQILSEDSVISGQFSNQTGRRDAWLYRLEPILFERSDDVAETVRPHQRQNRWPGARSCCVEGARTSGDPDHLADLG